MILRRKNYEKKIIGILLRSKSVSLKIIPRLRKELFSDKYYKKLFEVIEEHWQLYMTPPKKSMIMESLNKRIKRSSNVEKFEIIVDKMMNTEFDKNDGEVLTEKLWESFKARKLLKIVNSSLDNIENGKVEEALGALQLGVAKLQYRKDEKDSQGDYLSDFKERKQLIIDKKKNPEKYLGIPTGIKKFDNYYGGTLPSELGVIVAGSGVGKSIALMNFAVHAWLKGNDVVYVTIEMSKRECEFRIDSRISSISHRKFRKGEIDEDEMEKWVDKIKTLRRKRENKFHIIDVPDGCTTDFIEMKLLQMKDQLPDKFLLVVDYLNIMHSKSTKKGEPDWIVQGNIAKELKQLCRSWDIPCWTAAQQARGYKTNKRATEEDTGRSLGIIQNVNFLLMLIQTREMELDGIMELFCGKGRDGKMPTVKLHPDLSRMRLNIAYLGDKDGEKKEK